MKELDFLKEINETLDDNSYLGDDCAYLEDLDIFITQDTLVEDVHFSLETTTPYLLGRKAVAVNLSDLAASLSEPKYITISLSLPKTTEKSFVKEFYTGVNDICTEYGVKVVGGDLTGAKKIYISVAAIGKKVSPYTSSRANAKDGDLIITTGESGSSACGLFCLQNEVKTTKAIIEAHTNPMPRLKESKALSSQISSNITLMDTSDGLADALFKVSQASSCDMIIDFDKIPFNEELKAISQKNGKNLADWILWGGEDYELLACISKKDYEKLDPKTFKILGSVVKNSQSIGNVVLNKDSQTIKIDETTFSKKSFDHFEEKL